jgi:hypothetical protein
VNLLLGFGHGLPFGGGRADAAGEFIGVLHLLDGLEIFNVEDRPPVAGSLRGPIVAECNGYYPTPRTQSDGKKGRERGEGRTSALLLRDLFLLQHGFGLFLRGECTFGLRLGLGLGFNSALGRARSLYLGLCLSTLRRRRRRRLLLRSRRAFFRGWCARLGLLRSRSGSGSRKPRLDARPKRPRQSQRALCVPRDRR